MRARDPAIFIRTDAISDSDTGENRDW